MFTTILVGLGFKIGSYVVVAVVSGILGYAFRGKESQALRDLDAEYEDVKSSIKKKF